MLTRSMSEIPSTMKFAMPGSKVVTTCSATFFVLFTMLDIRLDPQLLKPEATSARFKSLRAADAWVEASVKASRVVRLDGMKLC